MVTIPEQEPVIQELNKDWHPSFDGSISMLRLDMIHSVVSGNKWYKLKYNIEYALGHEYKTVLSFGGAYSNHLIATAAAAKTYGLASVGIVRGNDGQELTATLKDCEAQGMQLVFVSREQYTQKENATWLEELSEQYGQPFIIPEGGANEQGRAGAEGIAQYINDTFSHVCVSAGTGTTLEGLRNGLPEAQTVLGYVPMKGGKYLEEQVSKYVSCNNYELFDEWHFGGFGKWNEELLQFMNEFYEINNIPLDIIYTGKMMYGIKEQVKQGYFPEGANILCIHTGGLQGNSSVKDKLHY